LVREQPAFQEQVVQRVQEGMKPADAVRETRRAVVVSQLESKQALETKALSGQYDVIVIDPPWPMAKIERDERPQQIELDYPTMSESELRALQVPCADNCHVWLWTTHKFLPMAFTLLENAMSVIFFHRVAIHRRHFLVSAMIPFIFMALIGAGLLLISLASGAIEALSHTHLQFLGREWRLDGLSTLLIFSIGFAGQVLLFMSLYLVMPLGGIAPRHALVGGLVAASLWEISRHFLIWYFKTLSLVNLIYGSFAGAVVVLLTFEVAALILLLGAQVIAEFERCKMPEENGAGSGFHT
jgi:hypothetical protein